MDENGFDTLKFGDLLNTKYANNTDKDGKSNVLQARPVKRCHYERFSLRISTLHEVASLRACI